MWNALGLWIANRNGSSSRQAARRRKRTAPSFDGLEGRRLLTSVVYQSGTIPADVAAEAVYVGSVQGTSYALMSNGDVDEYGNNTGVDPSTNLSTVSSDGNTVTTVEHRRPDLAVHRRRLERPGVRHRADRHSHARAHPEPDRHPDTDPDRHYHASGPDERQPAGRVEHRLAAPAAILTRIGRQSAKESRSPLEPRPAQADRGSPEARPDQGVIRRRRGNRAINVRIGPRPAARRRRRAVASGRVGRSQAAASAGLPRRRTGPRPGAPPRERRALPPGGAPGLQSLVAVDQQRLGLGVALQAQQAAAQQALHVEAAPFIGTGRARRSSRLRRRSGSDSATSPAG